MSHDPKNKDPHDDNSTREFEQLVLEMYEDEAEEPANSSEDDEDE